MKFRVKHRKLFYVPGMISLVLIPLICLWFINSNRYLHKDYSVAVQLSESYMKLDSLKDGYKLMPFYPKRNIENYFFNGDVNANKLQLKRVSDRINKLLKENDSINAVKIFFGKKMKYETYIDILDEIFINKVPSYVVNSNFIYVVNFPPKHKKNLLQKPVSMITCGYFEANKEFFAEQERKAARELFIKNMKRFWQIPLAFLAIVILNIYALIKFNRNRKYNQKSYI